MTQQIDRDVEAFRKEFQGVVVTPGDAGYDASRALWNGAIDRKPASIACCSTAAHVAHAIRFARSAGLEIAVRGGGHNYAGHAVCDGGLMIHLGCDESRRSSIPQRGARSAAVVPPGPTRRGDPAARAGDARRLHQPHRRSADSRSAAASAGSASKAGLSLRQPRRPPKS